MGGVVAFGAEGLFEGPGVVAVPGEEVACSVDDGGLLNVLGGYVRGCCHK